MIEEVRKADRRRQVEEIKKLSPVHKGRGADLLGLWACRLASGYSQQELADRAGTARGTVRSLERGDRRAHAATTRRLAEALDVEPADLLAAEATEGEE